MLRSAGIICLPFLLFHFAFNRLFGWDTSLACLSQSDRGILLTYHYISILLLGFMTVVLLFQAKAILASKLRYSVLGMIVLFFTLRIVTEFTLFGWSIPGSPVIILMCLAPVVLIIIPLASNVNQNNENHVETH